MQAVILAGGLATRMRPHTLRVPKSMLEVAGRPFVDWQLGRLAASGYSDVVMCVAYLGDQIRAHVGDGDGFGLRVAWSEEGPNLLGTAGALRVAAPLLEETFLVTYGDSYLPFDYAAPLRMLVAHDDCDGVMAVFRNNGRWDASNVVYAEETEARTEAWREIGAAAIPTLVDDAVGPSATGPNRGPASSAHGDGGAESGGWVLRYQKGTGDPSFDHIDYGATALRRAVVEALPRGEPSGLDAVQGELAARKRLRACVARERFYEVGSPGGLAELDRLLRLSALS